MGTVYDTHAALAELVEDAVVADGLADQERTPIRFRSINSITVKPN